MDTQPITNITPPPEVRIEDVMGNAIQISTAPTWSPRKYVEDVAYDSTNNVLYIFNFRTGDWDSFPQPGSITTFIPTSFLKALDATNPIDSGTVNVNTTAKLGLFNLPHSITINKFTYRCASVTSAGTFDISIYSEDGQTQKGTFETQTISAAQTYTDTLATPITLTPGNYWLMINSNDTASCSFWAWHYYQGAGGAGDFLVTLASEPTYAGTLTITASTPPTTFDPTTISALTKSLIECRFD